jgi:hypothetical protein
VLIEENRIGVADYIAIRDIESQRLQIELAKSYYVS